MKNLARISRSRGFSMIELMVVVSIMIVLAGLLIAALPGIQQKVARNRVEAFVAELGGGLERYKQDHGIYPLNEPSGDRDKAGIEGASVLYKHLSGDWNLDGTVDFEANEKVYVPRLDITSNKDSKEERAIQAGGEYLVVDPFGDPIRYLAQAPNIKPEDRLTRNPTYDLWSLGGGDPNEEDDEAKYIKNW